MTIYWRVYGSANDRIANPTANATYSVVRDSTTASVSTGTTAAPGQQWSGSTYSVRQFFPVFDTSTLPVGTTSATISFEQSTAADAGIANDQIELRAVSSADALAKIAGGSLAGKTPLYGSSPQQATFGRFSFAIDVSAMPRAAECWMVFHSQNERLNVPPTALERSTYFTADQTGTTQDPYLDATVGGWTLVGVSAVVESTTTGITLSEPAGVADGDLLIACFASRTSATTAITGTGWTAVGSQNNNNILTTTSALASGTMVYRVRAGTPTLSFTIPAGISVCLGRIVAYRGVTASSPLDASTAVTTAINTTPVSVTGLTTTQDDDLIVAMAAGGQEAAWSAFSNVTTPLGASGTTDTTTAPSSFAWIERADSLTTTNVDTSLAIFDAVRTTAGATGNLTATASLGAGHVVIAGAFKILPSAPVARNVTGAQTTLAATQSATATVTAAVTTGSQATNAAANAPATTTESVIPGFTPAATEDGDTDSNAYLCLGTHLYFTVAGTVSGVRFWWQNGDGNASTSGTVKLFDGNTYTGGSSTLLATKAYSGLSGSSGWREVTLDTPISVSANTLYVVGYEQQKGADGAFHYGYYTGYHSAADVVSVSTQIVIPSNFSVLFGETFLAGSYAYSGSPATVAPIGTPAGTQFGADVVFGIPGSNIIVVPGGGADFTVTGAQTLDAVATTATATATVTATAAQTTSAATQSATATVPRSVTTGTQTTNATTQSATAGARATVTTGSQTTLAATQSATAGARATGTAAQATLATTQSATAALVATVTGAQTTQAATLAATATAPAAVTGAQTTELAATAGTITVPVEGAANVTGAQTTLEAATAGTIALGALAALTVTGDQVTLAATTAGTIALDPGAPLTVTGAQTLSPVITAGIIGEVVLPVEVGGGGGASRAYVRRLREAVDRRHKFEEERGLRLQGLTLERPPLVPASETVAMIADVHEEPTRVLEDDGEEELLLLLLAS